MSKKSKVIITLCLCLCMVSILIPCFSLPVFAAGEVGYYSDAIYETIESDLPTYTHGLDGQVAIIDIYGQDPDSGVFYLNRMMLTNPSTDNVLYSLKYESSLQSNLVHPYVTYKADNVVNFYRTTYYCEYENLGNGFVCTDSGWSYMDSVVSGDSRGYFYGDSIPLDENLCRVQLRYANWTQNEMFTFSINSRAELTSPNLVPSPAKISFAGDVYGPKGHPFPMSQYDYVDIVDCVRYVGGNYSAPRIYFYYNSDFIDNYYYVRSVNGYPVINFYSRDNQDSSVWGEYFYTLSGVVYQDSISSDDSFSWTYSYYSDPSDLFFVMQNTRWCFDNGTEKTVDNSTDKIVGAVGDAAGQVTGKLDDIYNGDFPHELPTYDNDVDTESSDDLSEVSSSLLDSAKVDISIFDAIRNLDWDGVPLVGRFMTLVIDLGFADVVVYCLSMGLGLAILGKRFG